MDTRQSLVFPGLFDPRAQPQQGLAQAWIRQVGELGIQRWRGQGRGFRLGTTSWRPFWNETLANSEAFDRAKAEIGRNSIENLRLDVLNRHGDRPVRPHRQDAITAQFEGHTLPSQFFADNLGPIGEHGGLVKAAVRERLSRQTRYEARQRPSAK